MAAGPCVNSGRLGSPQGGQRTRRRGGKEVPRRPSYTAAGGAKKSGTVIEPHFRAPTRYRVAAIVVRAAPPRSSVGKPLTKDFIRSRVARGVRPITAARSSPSSRSPAPIFICFSLLGRRCTTVISNVSVRSADEGTRCRGGRGNTVAPCSARYSFRQRRWTSRYCGPAGPLRDGARSATFQCESVRSRVKVRVRHTRHVPQIQAGRCSPSSPALI